MSPDMELAGAQLARMRVGRQSRRHRVDIGIGAGGAYLISLAVVTVAAIVVGAWWFPGGEGERRLRSVLDETFGPSGETAA